MIFQTPEDIAFFRLVARRGALRLEILGMHRRGQSAYSICKQVYGLKGSRQRVLDQIEALVEAAIKAKHEGGTAIE